ncbi:hypothetical protein Egran_03974 [Elaphomyces granulatus]|uniref:Amino acid transporter transmembrane domain-containing protein n=1 Tax=Elaphomyces granulatus TaxID=519963 RepID=A0A232LW51_9EURO|nr:hypothetical protein Egran_03974 [Elaphomyces granulatus]
MALNSDPNSSSRRVEERATRNHKDGGKAKHDHDVESQTLSHGNTRRAFLHAGPHADDRASIGKQLELEAESAIKYRTCTWQKSNIDGGVALLRVYMPLHHVRSLVIFSPGPDTRHYPNIDNCWYRAVYLAYCLAILFASPGSSRRVRHRPIFVLEFQNCMPGFDTFEGLHCLVGAEYLNTMTDHATCSMVFSIVTAAVSFVVSLPRTFSQLSRLAAFSAAFTFVSLLLATIFAGIEMHPAGYSIAPVNVKGQQTKGEPIVFVIPAVETTFITGMAAFLNISYTFIGQITLPSFIAEMRDPEDFWKSITAVTIAEAIIFILVGAVIYVYTGNQYITAPAFGSLGNDVFKKVSFSFMIPTLIFLGVLYASVSARFVFFRLFDGSRHKSSHTIVGWLSWTGILAAFWALAFIIAEVIPFFSDLLSIMSSLFDSFFGFIFWGVAYMRMQYEDCGPQFYQNRGIRGWVGSIVNALIILIGLYFLGPGTYASVETVVQSYQAGTVGTPFSCASNALRKAR